MPQVPEDAHGEAVTPLRRLSKTHLGRFGGPQPSKMKSYRPALPGGGEFAPRRKHFLSLWRKRPGSRTLSTRCGEAVTPLRFF